MPVEKLEQVQNPSIALHNSRTELSIVGAPVKAGPAQLCAVALHVRDVRPRREPRVLPFHSNCLSPCSCRTRRQPPRAGARSPRCPPAANTEGTGEVPRGQGRLSGESQGFDPGTLPVPTRSSVCRLSSREKISLQDLSKERRPGGTGGPLIRDDDDREEDPPGENLGAWTPGSLGGRTGGLDPLV